MTNLLVSENYLNDLFLIFSIILLKLTLGIRQRTYLSLVRPMMEIQFLLAFPFIFPVTFLVPQRAALFMTSLLTVINLKPLLCRLLIFVLEIILKNKELSMELGITGLLEVTINESYLMEGYVSR